MKQKTLQISFEVSVPEDSSDTRVLALLRSAMEDALSSSPLRGTFSRIRLTGYWAVGAALESPTGAGPPSADDLCAWIKGYAAHRKVLFEPGMVFASGGDRSLRELSAEDLCDLLSLIRRVIEELAAEPVSRPSYNRSQKLFTLADSVRIEQRRRELCL